MITGRTILVAACLVASSMPYAQEEKGIIARTYEDGFPVILKVVDELPPQQIRERFQWLTVISWKYDGSERNGMPPEETNARMLSLERAITDHLEAKGCCRHAYSKTGNGLKELVYHIADREQFIYALNHALSDQPRYPIEINFYEDREWKDFQGILGMLKRTK